MPFEQANNYAEWKANNQIIEQRMQELASILISKKPSISDDTPKNKIIREQLRSRKEYINN